MVLGALWKRSNKARNSGLFFRRSFFNGRSPAIKDLVERDSLDNHARDSDCGVVTRVQPRSRRIVCDLRRGEGWRIEARDRLCCAALIEDTDGEGAITVLAIRRCPIEELEERLRRRRVRLLSSHCDLRMRSNKRGSITERAFPSLQQDY